MGAASTPASLQAYAWDSAHQERLVEKVLSANQSLPKLAESVFGRGQVSCMCLSPDVVLLSVPKAGLGALLIVGAPGARAQGEVSNLLQLTAASVSLTKATEAIAAFRRRFGAAGRVVRAAAVDADFAIWLEQSTRATALAAAAPESSDEDYVEEEDDTSSEEECTGTRCE